MSKKVKLIESDEIIDVDFIPEVISNGGTYVINQQNPNSYTHSYFKYPCKFIPEIPRWFINRELGETKGSVLDPFSGSGTSLVEAITLGHTAFGTEIDNLAKLLIKVKTTPLNLDEIVFIENWIDDLIYRSNEFQKHGIFNNINNLSHWFTKEISYKLSYIIMEIEMIQKVNVRDFLKICFASIIRKSSNADDVSPKPYVSSRIEKVPSDPLVIFPKTVKRYLNHMREFKEHMGNTKSVAKILSGDALDIKTDDKFDIAITSPPYINAFDYARTLRLENLWLNLETEESIRNKRREYVGTENITVRDEKEDLSILDDSEILEGVYNKIKPIDKRRALIVKRFFEEMKLNLQTVHQTLKPKGSYCIVIGNSTIRKVEVESWKIIIDIAKKIDFRIESYFSYVIQNRYLRIPRSGRGGKIRKDYVIVLRKNK